MTRNCGDHMRAIILIGLANLLSFACIASDQNFTNWSRKDATKVGKAYMAKGRVSGEGFRVMSKERKARFVIPTSLYSNTADGVATTN